MKINVSIEIEASKESVWAVITDISNSKNVISGILDLEVLHQPESGLIGLKWSETREMFGKEASETMWITDAKEYEYYMTRAESHGSVYITHIVLKEQGSSTELTMSFMGEGQTFIMNMLSKLMGVFMKKSMVKMMYKDLEDIKYYVENN